MSHSFRPPSAIFPGSFDPFTLGHLEVVARSMVFFSHIFVGVCSNERKEHWISKDDRIACINHVIKEQQWSDRVSVVDVPLLLVDTMLDKKSSVILRGIRSCQDLQDEVHIFDVNREINCSTDVFYLLSSKKNRWISASLVRDIARYSSSVQNCLPQSVIDYLKEKMYFK